MPKETVQDRFSALEGAGGDTLRRLDVVMDELSEIRVRLENIEDRVDVSITAELDDLRYDVDADRRDISGLESSIGYLEADIDELRRSVNES